MGWQSADNQNTNILYFFHVYVNEISMFDSILSISLYI